MTLALPIRDGIVQTICAAIDFYRRRISPHKGFACAYRVKHGRCSCSAFGLRAVKRCLLKFPLLLWRRLRRCAKAAQTLRPHILDYEAKKQQAAARPGECFKDATWNCTDQCGGHVMEAGCNVGCDLLTSGICDGI